MQVLEQVSEKGVTETRFDTEVDGRTVPGVMWMPAEGEPVGLMLLGHNVQQHKRHPLLLGGGRRFVRHHNIAAVAIDGPGHGDRAGAQAGSGNSWWTATAIDDTIADWQQAVVDVEDHTGFYGLPLGYWGMSMGTTLGLPLIAAEPRIRAAVLGLVGYSAVWRRVGDDANRVRCPVLFFAQEEDELVSLSSARELFDKIGSSEKELRCNPGDHLAVPPAEMTLAQEFLAKHLAAT